MRLPLVALLALFPSVVAITNPACVTVNVTTPPLDPTTQAFVDAGKDLPPIYTLSYPDARAYLEKAQGGPVDLPAGIELTILKLPVGPTGAVGVYLYKPKKKKRKLLPVLAYFHGGGWILGSPVTHQRRSST
jgi:acetyl esterase